MTSHPRRKLNWTLLSALIVGVVVAVLIGANAHLVWVALKSQPDCVAHARSPGEGETFRAARSAC